MEKHLEEKLSILEKENASLKDIARKYKRLVQNIPDVIYSLDDHGNVKEVNFPAIQFYGYNPDEIIGQHFLFFIHPDDHEAVINSLTTTIETKKEWTRGLEFRVYDKQGDIHWVEVHSHNHFNKDGNYTHEEGVIRNINDRKKTEKVKLENENDLMEEVWKRTVELESSYSRLETKIDELSITKKELKNREELLFNIINSMEDGILVLDQHYRYTYWSNRMAEISGVSQEEILNSGKKAWEYFPKLIDQGIDKLMKQAMGGIVVSRDNIPFDLPTGNKGYISKTFFPLKTTSGEIHGVIGLIRDVTDLKQINEEKEKLKIQLQRAQKMEAIGTLAGGIAHDFNNILFPVMGYTEMLLQDISPDNEIYNSLVEMLKGMQKAKELIKQILSFSRQTDFESKPQRIQPIIKEAVTLLRSSLPSTISINQYLKKDCGPVFTNESQIHQLIMNLCTNAFHAMHETGGTLNIKLNQNTLSRDDAKKYGLDLGVYSILTVEDTGDGIPAEILPLIFNPYFTTKANGKGTGLGLSVSHGIVKRNKGHIKVESTVGKGTLFTVFLPICENDPIPQKVPSLPSIKKGQARILLIDDQKSVLDIEKKMLERLGYKVTDLLDSVTAISLFKKHPNWFDLVITDMTMPNLTGDKLSIELLKIRPDIPIIICTGYSELLPVDQISALGISGYFMKPVGIYEMSEKIHSILS